MSNRADEQALLGWKQRKAEAEAAASEAAKTEKKSTPQADSAKGIVAGVSYGTAAGFAALADMAHYLLQNYKGNPPVLTSMLEEWSQGYLATKNEAFKHGFEFGNVASYFTDPTDLVNLAAVGGVKKVLTREEEIAKLAREQAEDAHDWMRRGGNKPLFDQYGVPPKNQGERQVSAHKGSVAASETNPEATKIDADGMVQVDEDTIVPADELKGIERTEASSTAYTQTEGNPMERSGYFPGEYPQYGQILEDTKMLATRGTRVGPRGNRQYVWQDGKFNPQAADVAWSRALRSKEIEAAKSRTKGIPPRYFVLDRDTGNVWSISRDKNGQPVVKKEPKAEGWSRDPAQEGSISKKGPIQTHPESGERVPHKYIDEAIDSSTTEGKTVKEYLDAKVGKALADPDEGLLVRAPGPRTPETAWDADAGDKPGVRQFLDQLDASEGTAWRAMSPTARRDFVTEKFKQLRDETLAELDDGKDIEMFLSQYHPNAWRTPKPETSGKTLKTKRKAKDK